MERWKDINGYEGLYQVSDKGRVRSLSHITKNNVNGGQRMTTGRILNPYKTRNGYLMVILSKNEKRERAYIHRLTAYAFIDNKNNLREINHIDGNKSNNDIENLEWVTHKENQNHAFNNMMNKKAHPVICEETQIAYRSMTMAAKAYGIDRHCIKQSCESGEPFKCLHWRYYHE